MRVTVGICAFNEGKSLAKNLASVLPQLAPDDELVLVASGCTDNTVEEARSFAARDARVRLEVEAQRNGKAAALNKILATANGSFIVLTDADVVLERNALEKLLEPFKERDIGAVIGRTESLCRKSFWDGLQGFAWQSFNELRERQSRDGTLFALNGYLSAVRNGIVDRLPLDCLVEDWMLGWKIRERGYRVVFRSDAMVYVKAAQSLSDYLRQKVRVRVGQLQVHEQGMDLAYVRQPANLGWLFKSPYALPYLVLDVLAWGLAFFRHRTGTLKWEPVTSSKP